MLNPLKLVQPTSVQEASQSLAEFGDKAKIYAGGAELLLLLRNGLIDGEILIDVKKIERLRRLDSRDGTLHVGACLNHHELATNAAIRERAPSFAYAESQLANIRVRNQGTLGGNLAFNDPHSDPGTILLVHNASVTIGNAQGERRLALGDFFLDMYATALEAGELLLEVEIPPLPAGMTSAYQRLHRYQRPTLGVAVAARIAGSIIADPRLAVGCIGPKAQRLTALESKINGMPLTDTKKIFAEQKKYLRDVLQPVDDLLGSVEYKLYMTEVMLGDALAQAAGEGRPEN